MNSFLAIGREKKDKGNDFVESSGTESILILLDKEGKLMIVAPCVHDVQEPARHALRSFKATKNRSDS